MGKRAIIGQPKGLRALFTASVAQHFEIVPVEGVLVPPATSGQREKNVWTRNGVLFTSDFYNVPVGFRSWCGVPNQSTQ